MRGGRDVGGEGAAQLCSRGLMNGAFVLAAAAPLPRQPSAEAENGPALLPPSARPRLPSRAAFCLGRQQGLDAQLRKTAPDPGHPIGPKRLSPVRRQPRALQGWPGLYRGVGEQGRVNHPCSGFLGAANSQTTLRVPNYFQSPKRIKVSCPQSCTQSCKTPKQDLCQLRKSFRTSHWGNFRGKKGDFQVAFNLHRQHWSPFRAAFDIEAAFRSGQQHRSRWERRAGAQHAARAAQGMPEPAGELCWGRDTAAALLRQRSAGFTFRSVLRIQMKVQTLGLLGHFSTMNPPGPFSPLWGTKSAQSEPGTAEKPFSNALGCTAPIPR